ncbi:nucleotidyltransferase domain-containing protein [Candidatus Woesearchaeota archaeon]|nr:nucleotidyltransferase domain-containing protein [Candidatus Woesearchaeota archaeon]
MIIIEFMHLIENNYIDFIYLFGSHAKKTASQHSDIDIAIFSQQNINLIKEEERIETKFNKELQIHYFKTEDLKSKNKIIENILKDGVKIL